MPIPWQFCPDSSPALVAGNIPGDPVGAVGDQVWPWPWASAYQPRIGTIYYVDSALGSDSNPGTAPGAGNAWASVAKVNATTFHPGDSILFQGGQTWSGTTLGPSGSGVAGNPITIGSYGTGQATFTHGTGQAIQFYNQGGYTLSNLTVTGLPGAAAGNYNGIEWYLSGVGQLPAITITGCNVSGWYAGITIGSGSTTDGFNGINITGCNTYGNTFIGTTIYGGTFVPTAPGYSHQNVLISGCNFYNNPGISTYTSNWSGMGLAVSSVTGGLVTNCTAYANGIDNGCTTAGPGGIEIYWSNNVTVQYSVAYGNVDRSLIDGDGFDLDTYCTNCTIQYCIAYSNAGAGILGYAAGGYWSGNTIRYNMCWGNAQINSAPIYGDITIGGTPGTCNVYGNTVATIPTASGNIAVPLVVSGTPTGINIWNNILYDGGGSGQVLYAASAYTPGQLLCQGNDYWSNTAFTIYWGASYASLTAFQSGTGQEMLSASPVGMQANPLLANPGIAPTTTSMATLSPGADGLVPLPGSPVMSAGLPLLADFNISPGMQDFFGNALSLPLWIGAVQTANPVMATLQDAFSVNDLATLWGNSFGAPVLAAGQATIPCTTSGAALSSTAQYNLTGSYLFALVSPALGATYITELWAEADGGDYASVSYYEGYMYGMLLQGGVQTNSAGVAYNPELHAWWRVRESFGTLYFETAPDGLTWSLLWSSTYTIPVTAMNGVVYTYATTGTATTYVDNINLGTGSVAPAALLVPWQFRPHAGPGEPFTPWMPWTTASGRGPATITATAWPKPFIFRGPAPHRALAGNSLLCGDGVAVLAVSLGVPVTKSFRYSAGGAW